MEWKGCLQKNGYGSVPFNQLSQSSHISHFKFLELIYIQSTLLKCFQDKINI
jgi:hypothetical protein